MTVSDTRWNEHPDYSLAELKEMQKDFHCILCGESGYPMYWPEEIPLNELAFMPAEDTQTQFWYCSPCYRIYRREAQQ